MLKATSDLADGDVRNGIADEFSILFLIPVAKGTLWVWHLPPVISAPAGVHIGYFFQDTDQIIDTMNAGFSRPFFAPSTSTNVGHHVTHVTGDIVIKVPENLAAGDYPITVVNTTGSSEARANIIIRVTP